MNFEEAYKELRTMAGTKYIGLETKTTEFADTPKEIVHSVYIDGFKWHNGATWIEALASLQKAMREDTNEDNQ